MCGSALIGPDTHLGRTPKTPHAIQPLCRSPIYSLVHEALQETVGSKLTFVGLHFVWTAYLEPPTNICADITISESQGYNRLTQLTYYAQVHWLPPPRPSTNP